MQTALFPWHTVIVITHAEIECEIRTNLPIVFEECSPFILVVVLNPNERRECRIRWTVGVIRQAGVADRARQIEQQILCGRGVLAES